MTLPRNQPIYQRRKAAAPTVPTAKPVELTAHDVLADAGPLPDEKQTREGAMCIAQRMQQARPHKVVVVFNIFGYHRWFVCSFNEDELRRFLSKSKQTKPLTRK
jgi:hypothetical protein